MTRRSRLKTHLRVLHALLLREMITRYGRTSLGYVWALLEPVAVIALLTLLFMQIAQAPPYGHSFALFYATGYIAFHWVIDISSVSARSVHVNRPLLAFPNVSALDTVLARFLLQALTGLAVAVIVFGAIVLGFAESSGFSLAPLLTAYALALLLAFSIGLVNCWGFTISKGWELAWGVVSRPLLLVSCVFYSFESLPTMARDVLWYNPIVHIVGLMRAGFYPIYDPAHVSVAYVLSIAMGLSLVGLWSLRNVRARMAVG